MKAWGAAALAASLMVAGGSVGALAAQARTAPASMRPTAAQIAKVMRQATEVGTSGGCAAGKSSCAEHLHAEGREVTVSDGHGGWLTAVPAVRWPTADGYGQYLLFWHNRTFAGTQNLMKGPNLGLEAVSVGIVKFGANGITARYANYAGKDAMCCPSLKPVLVTYRWYDHRVEASRKLPRTVTTGLKMTLKG